MFLESNLYSVIGAKTPALPLRDGASGSRLQYQPGCHWPAPSYQAIPSSPPYEFRTTEQPGAACHDATMSLLSATLLMLHGGPGDDERGGTQC